jgi:hypothetical protein
MWDLLLTRPSRLTLGFRDRPTVVASCSPTDEVSYTYFTDGMRHRVGDNPKPSMVFLLSHVLWLDRYFGTLYRQAITQESRRTMAQAIVTHIIAILGWLRASETCGLHWGDITINRPADGPTLGLPAGIGCDLFTLLAQTKSEQVRTVNLPLAYMSASGLALGLWLEILQSLTRLTSSHLLPSFCVTRMGRLGRAITIAILIFTLRLRFSVCSVTPTSVNTTGLPVRRLAMPSGRLIPTVGRATPSYRRSAQILSERRQRPRLSNMDAGD